MSFKFGGTAADLTPSQGGQYARMPYLGPLRLVDVNVDQPSDDPNKAKFDVIQFHWEILDGPEKGSIYRHIEWEPKSQDQADNTWKRLGHILSQYLKGDRDEAKEKAARALAADSWNDLRNKVLNIFNEQMKKEVYSKKTLQGKILGWIIQQGRNAGKPDYGFPGYIGFLSNENSDVQVSFSPREAQNNEAYVRALTAAPAQGGGVAPASAPAAGGQAPATTGGASGTAEPLEF